MKHSKTKQSEVTGKKLKDYVAEISEYWNDDEMVEQLGRAIPKRTIF
jgi:hypothetical protein